jgi:hypothetical protein
MNWSKTESATLATSLSPAFLPWIQGFQVSDDEISMDLNTFRQNFANNGGVVE